MARIPYQTLYCPFQCTISPHAAAIDQHTLDWANSFALIPNHSAAQRFQEAHFGWLAGCLAPSASYESLQLLSDWYTWAILWDDVCDQPSFVSNPDRLADHQTQFLMVLRGDSSVTLETPVIQALWNIRQRLRHHASQFQFHQFINHVQEFFAGSVWEATNRAYQHQLDLASYIRMRRYTSGMYTSLKVIESTEQLILPSIVWKSRAVLRLREQATNAVCWANDIISLQQESQRGDIHNLILILQQTNGWSLDQALAQAVHLHDAEVDAFQTEAQRSHHSGHALIRRSSGISNYSSPLCMGILPGLR